MTEATAAGSAEPDQPTSTVNTPGFSGYAAALGLTVLVLALVLPIDAVAAGDVGGYLGAVPFVMLFALLYVVPFAVPALFVVHLLCRGASNQVLHVLVAWVAGLLAGLVASRMMFDGRWGWFPFLLAVALAAGRWGVIPLVWRARRTA